jgi:hypothetical protein
MPDFSATENLPNQALKELGESDLRPSKEKFAELMAELA